MSRDNKNIMRHVLYVGPDRRSRGGIAYVADVYETALGGICYAPTTSCRGKAAGALRFAATMALLPLYRLRGRTIVHAHGSVRGSWKRKCLLLNWARILGMHTVHHIHNGALRKHFAAMGEDRVRRQLSRADRVVALTHGWERYLSNELGLRNVTVIENPVEPPRSTRRPVPDGPLRLLYLSSIDHTKGLFELLEALSKHSAELRGRVRLDLAGTGVDEPRLRDYMHAHAAELEGMVQLRGWAAGEAKEALLESNDVFVLPSYAEGMPISLLEAMAAGLAAIVTPVGGIPEAVAAGEGGIHVEPRDSESIYRAILHFLDRPADIDTMGEHNRRVAQRYFPDEIARKLLKLYEDIETD